MGSLARFGRYLKDFWKVVIRGENDDLQRQTRSVEEQVARIRERRKTKEKEREAAALNEARIAVEKIQEFHKSLLAAEEAASEFAAKLGEHAKKHLEAETQMGEKTRMKFLLRQRELFQQEIKKGMGANAGALSPQILSQLNEGTEAAVQPEGRSASEHLCSSAAMSQGVQQQEPRKQINANLEDTGVPSLQLGDKAEVLPLQQDPSLGDEHVMPPRISGGGIDQAALQKHIDAKLEDTDDVSPIFLEHLVEEARKQVRLQENAHIEALSIKKEILEQEIEARAEAEHASISQGKKRLG